MTPFVPVIVSRITAATFCGPSYWRISSRCGAPVQTGHGSGCPAGQRYVYGSSMRTIPGSPGSAGQRRGSPVAEIAPAVAPWYERYRVTILCRPVYQRASLIAFSFASAPPFVKNDIVRSPGVTSARSRASSERCSFAIIGPIVVSRSACSLIAAITFGCWCPSETLTSCDAKSR